MTDIKPDLVVTDLPDASPSNPLEALSWLGETVEEVAGGLRARGIKGRLADTMSCPLAQYLHLWWADAWVWDTVSDGCNPDAPTPDPCWHFIEKFDNREFPNLIDNG